MTASSCITSVQNPRIKQVVKLRDRRGRESQDRIVVDGSREIRQALDAGISVHEAFLCEDYLTSPEANACLDRLASTGIRPWHVTPTVWEKLAFGHRREGLLITATPPRTSLEELPQAVAEADSLVIVLDGVEKPGNVGAVCRTADGAGVAAMLLTDLRTDIYNPNAIRSSLGTIFRIPVVRAEVRDIQHWLGAHHFHVFIARLDGEEAYDRVNLSGRCAVVLGSEADGVGPAWLGDRPNWTPVFLPMEGTADSLNVSNAAAILAYEALRQRRRKELE